MQMGTATAAITAITTTLLDGGFLGPSTVMSSNQLKNVMLTFRISVILLLHKVLECFCRDQQRVFLFQPQNRKCRF